MYYSAMCMILTLSGGLSREMQTSMTLPLSALVLYQTATAMLLIIGVLIDSHSLLMPFLVNCVSNNESDSDKLFSGPPRPRLNRRDNRPSHFKQRNPSTHSSRRDCSSNFDDDIRVVCLCHRIDIRPNQGQKEQRVGLILHLQYLKVLGSMKKRQLT